MNFEDCDSHSGGNFPKEISGFQGKLMGPHIGKLLDYWSFSKSSWSNFNGIL